MLGYFTPWMIGGCVLLCIGGGLLTTLQPDTGHAKWLGYQILAGMGVGFGLQQSILAVQAALPLVDVPTATAVVVFGQSLGGALTLAAVTNVFNNKLVSNLQTSIPEISNIVSIVLNAGATKVIDVITAQHPEALARVLIAYNEALVHLFYGCVVLGALALVAACFMPWINIKGKNIEMAAA